MKCLGNRWKFDVADGWVTATCQNCSADVVFQARNKRRPPGSPTTITLRTLETVAEVLKAIGSTHPSGRLAAPLLTHGWRISWIPDLAFVDDGRAPW